MLQEKTALRLTQEQKAYRKSLLDPRPRKASVPKEKKTPGRKPSVEHQFPTAFKAFKETGEYKALYAAIQNREQFIEHLIYRAFQAGFKARK